MYIYSINCLKYIYRLETSIMSYFTLLHICKYLEIQNLHQTSQILTKFKIEDIMFSIRPVTSNPEYEKLYEESVNLITFKTHKKIKVLPLHKIKKYVKYSFLYL